MFQLVLMKLNWDQPNQNPLVGLANRTYNLTWTYSDQSYQFSFKHKTGLIPLQLNETSKILSGETATHNRISTIIKDGDTFQAKGVTVQGQGDYYAKYNRGIVSLAFYYYYSQNYEINSADYLPQIMDSTQSWPNDEQRQLLGTESDPKQCQFIFYYTRQAVLRDISSNKYKPDYQLRVDETSYFNSTHEYVAQLTGKIISRECGIELDVQGSLFNNAVQIRTAAIYCVVLTVCEMISILSSLRLMLASTNPAKLQRLDQSSFLMQLVYDLCLMAYHVMFSRSLSNFSKPLVLIAMLIMICAFFVDIILYFRIQQQRRGRPRDRRDQMRRDCCSQLIFIVLFCVFIYFYSSLPAWVTFIITLLISSHWALQSIYCIRMNLQRRFLPFDYLILQTIVKYAPVYYFYGIDSNFMKFLVENWYKWALAFWFGIQIGLIFLQYLFGSRLFFKRYQTVKHVDLGLERAIPMTYLSIVHPQQLLNVCAEEGKNAEEYINEKLNFVVPVDAEHCMNPLHEHSALYQNINVNLLNVQPPIINRLNTNCKCFAFISLADNDLQCPICLESIAIQHVKNKFPLCITNDTVSEIKMIRTEGTQELYVTNCNHIFHGACLHKWALENPVCPVCRQEINGW
ncbi:RING-H2_zinc finger-containing protein [Hexamita inflata]|uniref:RING-type E3 ubiquitin transferase n=1 Tax=Hexamita inflata TaxID=28002 RepID=A0AA86U656_9EUKA|nr:RING-H2 zinc finger-containing protein [Hexamita inflata]CAI9942474.1 RING-H2 zinc finger-containing protein [Hexamita inflata]